MKFSAEEQFKWEDKWKSSVRWISRMFNDTLLWGWMRVMWSFENCLFLEFKSRNNLKTSKTWMTNDSYVNRSQPTLLCAAEKRRINDEITWEFNQMPQKLCFVQLCSLANETRGNKLLCCWAAIKVLSVSSANIDSNLNNFSQSRGLSLDMEIPGYVNMSVNKKWSVQTHKRDNANWNIFCLVIWCLRGQTIEKKGMQTIVIVLCNNS